MPAAVLGALAMVFAVASNASAAVEVESASGYSTMGSTCWIACGTAKSRFESNWLSPDPKGDIEVWGYLTDTVTHSSVSVTKAELDLNSDGLYDVEMANPGSGSFSGVFKNVMAPSSATDKMPIKLRFTAMDLSQAEKTLNIRPLGMRRIFVNWDNASRVDLHAWRTAPLERDAIGHLWYDGGLNLRPSWDVWSSGDGPYVDARDSAQGTKPIAMAESPLQFFDEETDLAIGPSAFPDAYTIGICQYSGTNATVNVTITELNGQSRTLTMKLANEKDGWLVGTTAGGSVIPARGWCGDHDPTTIGASSVQPLGKLKSKKTKRRKTLKILLAEVPNRALIGYRWKGKGGSKGVATAGKNVLRLKTPAKAGKFKFQLTYLGKKILSTTVTVK